MLQAELMERWGGEGESDHRFCRCRYSGVRIPTQTTMQTIAVTRNESGEMPRFFFLGEKGRY